MNPIMQARSFSDLYLNRGEVCLKPKDFLSRLIIDVWERIYSFFDSFRGIDLETKVVEALYLAKKEEGPSMVIAKKVKALSLESHFSLRVAADLPSKDSFEKTVKKAQLSWVRKLVLPAGGATGSAYFVLDPFDKKEIIGVFKTEQNRGLWVRFTQFVKSFFGHRYYLNLESGAEAIAEEASYALSREIGAHVAVPSRSVSFSGTYGNFQKYAKWMTPSSAKEDWFKKEAYIKSEKLLFDKYAVFNYLTGNLDSHRENLLFDIDKEGVLKGLVSLDNANTYPRRSYGWWHIFPPPDNQYAWARERIALCPFEKESLEWIKEVTSEESEEMLKETFPFLTKDQKRLLKERFAILRKHAKEGSFSPRDLLQYRYGSNVQKFLSAG